MYDAAGTKKPIHIIEKLHYHPVHLIKVNRIEFLKKDLFWWLDICELIQVQSNFWHCRVDEQEWYARVLGQMNE